LLIGVALIPNFIGEIQALHSMRPQTVVI